MNYFPISKSTSRNESMMWEAITGRLFACYQEFYRSDRILVDHQAARAFPEILQDMPKFKAPPQSQRVSQLTSVIRSRWFDQIVNTFLTQLPNTVVVNLRSRLCTRYWRLPNLHEYWYEVDNEDIMNLRQRYFTIVPRDSDIICDCMNFDWMNKIQKKDGQSILVIFEGGGMYFSPEENQALFETLRRKLGPVHVLFDNVSPKFIPQSEDQIFCPSENFLGEIQQPFHWGIEKLSDLKDWGILPRLIRRKEYLLDIKNYPERLEPWMTNFWPMLKPLLQKSAQIYHLYLQ